MKRKGLFKKAAAFLLSAAMAAGLIAAFPAKEAEAAPAGSITMYRLCNNGTGEHFYTGNVKEKDALVASGAWADEGTGWYAPERSGVPVYRLCNVITGDHHYTRNEKEKNVLSDSGLWNYEGVGWYSDEKQGMPLYRELNPNAIVGAHNYTSSKKEHNYLTANGWVDEGIGWYGLKEEISDKELAEAVSLGIIDANTAARANEPALETEIPAMLQAAYRHGYGKDSTFLANMNNIAEPGRTASRFWVAMGIFYPYCEQFFGKNVTDCKALMDEIDFGFGSAWMNDAMKRGFTKFDSLGITAKIMNPESNYELGAIYDHRTISDLAADFDNINFGNGNDSLKYRHDFGDWWATQTTFSLNDRVTGEPVLGLDSRQYWNPAQKMTIGDAAKAALRYWHSFEDAAVRVSYDKASTYDKTIIPDSLLNKTSSLPDNSCANLPAEWHGKMLEKWSWVSNGALDGATDRVYRENEIEIVKEAGFNFVKLNLSFSLLQAPNVEKGMLNETRLKEIDRLLSYCIKNDIHLSIACSQIQDISELEEFQKTFETRDDGPKTDEEIAGFTAIWRALARRYAAIPNKYLSFNLYNEIHCDENEYVRRCGPAIDAIRSLSPDRTIIADIFDKRLTGESMAKKGVALSYHLYAPMKFTMFVFSDPKLEDDPEYLNSVKWPFTHLGITYDAKSALDVPDAVGPDWDGRNPGWTLTPNSLREVAKQNGVGFMIGEFGVVRNPNNGYAEHRYTDETYYGYLTDMIETFKSEGIGWSIDNTPGPYDIFQPYPLLSDVKYEKVGPWYIDTGLKDFFRKINGS